jgi:hypothetical protein
MAVRGRGSEIASADRDRHIATVGLVLAKLPSIDAALFQFGTPDPMPGLPAAHWSRHDDASQPHAPTVSDRSHGPDPDFT